MTFDTEKLEWFDYPMLKNIALPCTVFQLFDIEYYRDLEIWVKGHSRSFKLVPFESFGAVSYLHSIVAMTVSCIILETRRDIDQKSWFFHTALAFDAPVRGTLSDYCLAVWCGKTIMMCLPDGGKSLTICLPVLTECANVTDRHTPRRTLHDG